MRRIATRYDKTALSFISFLNLTVARFWIRSFVNISWLQKSVQKKRSLVRYSVR